MNIINKWVYYLRVSDLMFSCLDKLLRLFLVAL